MKTSQNSTGKGREGIKTSQSSNKRDKYQSQPGPPEEDKMKRPSTGNRQQKTSMKEELNSNSKKQQVLIQMSNGQ